MTSIKSIIFDLYDTLAYFNKSLYIKKIEKCATWCGVKPEKFREVWNSFVVESNLGILPTTADRVIEVLKALSIHPDKTLVNAIAETEHDFLKTGILLFDDTIDIIKKLRNANYKLGIITNASKSVDIVFETTGLKKFMDCVVVSNEVKLRKPDPAIYKVALDRLDVEAQNCVFVGDGNDKELDGAYKVGMITVMIDRGLRKNVETENSSIKSTIYRIKSLKELWNIISQEVIDER